MSVAESSEHHAASIDDMHPTTANGTTNFGFEISDRLVVNMPPLSAQRSETTLTEQKIRRPVCAVRPQQAASTSVSLSVEVRDETKLAAQHDGWAQNNYDRPRQKLPSKKPELSEKVKERLSKTSYYHGRLSTQDARLLLKNQPVGTYLVRDSESPNHMFSISSRTSRGTTSVRVSYDVTRETFELDVAGFTNSGKPVGQSPRFTCITAIVDYLVSTGAGGEPCLCVENDGRSDTPFLLIRPLPSATSL